MRKLIGRIIGAFYKWRFMHWEPDGDVRCIKSRSLHKLWLKMARLMRKDFHIVSYRKESVRSKIFGHSDTYTAMMAVDYSARLKRLGWDSGNF